MKFSLAIPLFTFLALVSCAKKPTTRITVKVPDTFSGTISLTPCISVAKDPVVLDETNYGYTPACPLGDVEIAVIKGKKTFIITPEKVRVRRRSDGEAVTISAEIPGT
jgi:hypothetical protein